MFTLSLRSVCCAVDFNNQTSLAAGKINIERADWELSAELQIAQLSGT